MSFATIEQESILAVMAFDADGCLAARTILPEHAYDSLYRRLFVALAQFIDKFRKPPGEHLLDICNDLKERRPKDAELMDQIYDSVRATWDAGLNRDFVFERARLYGRGSRYLRAIEEAVKELGVGITQDRVDKAEQLLRASLKESDISESLGVNTRDPNFTDFLDDEDDDVLLTGIPAMDRVGAGPVRQGLWVLAAKYGGGKTFSLTDLAVQCSFLNRIPVVIFSLEMSEKKMSKRTTQRITGTGNRDEVVSVSRLRLDLKGKLEDIVEDELSIIGMKTPKGKKKVRAKMEWWRNKPAITIKAWPSGTATVPMMRAYLERLRASTGVTPGLVIVDYLGIMEIKRPENKRLELGAHAVELRALAQEWKCAVATAVQLNAEGADSANARGTKISEDRSINHHADRVWIYNQTPEEKALGLARLISEKNRDDSSVEVLISQAYAAGKFVLDSCKLTRAYKPLLEQLTGGSDDD